MTMVRIKKREKNFVVLEKSFLEDSILSLGAKGLYAYLVGFPENIKRSGILRFSKDDSESAKGYIKELEEAGYLIVENKSD